MPCARAHRVRPAVAARAESGARRLWLVAAGALAGLLLLAVMPARAGTIAVLFDGSPNVTATAGVLITADVVITFGPTPVGGAGAAIELSFDYAGGSVVGGGGVPLFPSGWFDLTGGAFTCNDGAGHCENIIAAGDFVGFGAVFPSGSTFLVASITIDTSGIAPGVYAISAGFSGPADAVVNPGAVDLSDEYTSIRGTYATDGPGIPEPTTAALLASGLLALAALRR